MIKKGESFALTEANVSSEVRSIQECWKILTPLESRARARVLEWLESWIRSESPNRDRDDF